MGDFFSIHLDSDLTIKQVNELHLAWKEGLSKKNLHIDAADVKNIDTAGLQLLLYSIISIRMKNGNISWVTSPSGKLKEAALLTGMSEILFDKWGKDDANSSR